MIKSIDECQNRKLWQKSLRFRWWIDSWILVKVSETVTMLVVTALTLQKR